MSSHVLTKQRWWTWIWRLCTLWSRTDCGVLHCHTGALPAHFPCHQGDASSPHLQRCSSATQSPGRRLWRGHYSTPAAGLWKRSIFLLLYKPRLVSKFPHLYKKHHIYMLWNPASHNQFWSLRPIFVGSVLWGFFSASLCSLVFLTPWGEKKIIKILAGLSPLSKSLLHMKAGKES